MTVGADEAQVIFVVLAVLAVPTVVLAALQWWAVWLVRRSAAPSWPKWVLPALMVVPVVGAVVGFAGAFKAVGHVAPADKATILAASISEGMNTGAFFCFPLPVLWLGVLSSRPTAGCGWAPRGPRRTGAAAATATLAAAGSHIVVVVDGAGGFPTGGAWLSVESTSAIFWALPSVSYSNHATVPPVLSYASTPKYPRLLFSSSR